MEDVAIMNRSKQVFSVASDMSGFDPIELAGSRIPFADPFSFVDGEFGEWPEPASESRRTMDLPVTTPLRANSPSLWVRDKWDVELVHIKQSERWRKAGLNRIVGTCTKLESSFFEDSDAQVHVSAPLTRHTWNSRNAFTPGACPFMERTEASDVCSHDELKQYQGARLFDLGSQLPFHHVELFEISHEAACESGSSSRMEDNPVLTENRLNQANHKSQGRGQKNVIQPLLFATMPVVAASVPAPRRARLNTEQAVHIFNQRATKTKQTAALLAAEYGISPKAIRDIWTRRSWAEDTRPSWTHQDEESSNP